MRHALGRGCDVFQQRRNRGRRQRGQAEAFAGERKKVASSDADEGRNLKWSQEGKQRDEEVRFSQAGSKGEEEGYGREVMSEKCEMTKHE